ncbi:MAG TPA: hypothetical protein PKN86_13890, partial [Candidatus Obscuribacter sp.]|nr:hypothetical protein [Candidatus Obscuribacter sp.]
MVLKQQQMQQMQEKEETGGDEESKEDKKEEEQPQPQPTIQTQSKPATLPLELSQTPVDLDESDVELVQQLYSNGSLKIAKHVKLDEKGNYIIGDPDRANRSHFSPVSPRHLQSMMSYRDGFVVGWAPTNGQSPTLASESRRRR